MKFSKKYSILLEKCLTNPHVRHTLCSGKQKTLSHWKSRPSGRSTGTSSECRPRLRSPLLNRLVKAGSPRWQTPLGGGAIRFKVRLVCGHPPKSGSGHGRRMRRPIRFRCAAASLLSCRSGRRGKRVRHDKPDRLAKGPYDYLLGGWRGRREFISLAS